MKVHKRFKELKYFFRQYDKGKPGGIVKMPRSLKMKTVTDFIIRRVKKGKEIYNLGEAV